MSNTIIFYVLNHQDEIESSWLADWSDLCCCLIILSNYFKYTSHKGGHKPCLYYTRSHCITRKCCLWSTNSTPPASTDITGVPNRWLFINLNPCLEIATQTPLLASHSPCCFYLSSLLSVFLLSSITPRLLCSRRREVTKEISKPVTRTTIFRAKHVATAVMRVQWSEWQHSLRIILIYHNFF